MARTAAGLTVRQTALLLRCERVRGARLQAEAARCEADHADATRRSKEAHGAAERHAVTADAMLRREYDGLVGRGSDVGALRALRARELAAGNEQARLVEASTAGREMLERTAVLAAEARQVCAEVTRRVTRRERLFEAAARDWARTRAAGEELRDEDRQISLFAWRG